MEELTRYRDLVEALSQVVYEVDPTGRFTYVNPVAEEIFGITRSIVDRGLWIPQLLGPEDRERAARNIGRIMQGENIGVREYVVQGPNGRRVPVVIDSRPIIVDGEIVGLRGVVIDISRQKQLDAELQAAARLASIGLLAAGLAHEINNPLTSVLGNLQVLDAIIGDSWAKLDPGVAAELREVMDDVLTGTNRVARITRDLSVLARADDGPSVPVLVDDCIEQAMAIAQNQVTHSARVRREGVTGLRVDGREHRLVQVFTNLLVNAAQNLPEQAGDHEIVICAREDGENVVCQVRDTGPGIPEALLPKVFEPFVTGRAHAGTGMGLAICNRIVQGMGGRITARNQVDGGACFDVRLPTSRKPAPVGDDEPKQVDLTGIRVLVVDDDASVRRVLRRMLADTEFEAVSGGREAIERIAHSSFDVVLCDLMMPDLTGCEVHRRVRSVDADQARRFTFITGGIFRDEVEEYLHMVDLPVVSKPLDRDDLRRVVRRVAGLP